MSKIKSGLLAAAAASQKAVEQISVAEREHAPLRYLSPQDLDPSPFQPRRDFTGIEDLAEDIRINGVLQPVLARPTAGGRYQLVAGERRWRASKLAGRPTIPTLVREMTDAEARLFSLRENLQREDLNAYEVAQAVVQMVATQLGRSVEDIQASLGSRQPEADVQRELEQALGMLSKRLTLRSYQRHYLPLLRLDSDLTDALEKGVPYSAVLLLRNVSASERGGWIARLLSGELSRAQLEQELKAAKHTAPDRVQQSAEYDWGGRLASVNSLVTESRLRDLDSRKQRKAKRLLEELEALLRAD